MTYFQFHLWFNLPLLVLTGFLAGETFWTAPVLWAAGLVLLAVMIFTTPWDNYAVAQGIWGFPRQRFSGKIGYLPVEEYLFFIIESLQVMWFAYWLMQVFPDTPSFVATPLFEDKEKWIQLGLVAVLWLRVGWWGRKKVDARSRFHYAWHLLFWFVPLLMFQWVIAWEVLWPRVGVLATATLAIGSYLSVADYIAIDKGIWHFDQRQITGFKLGGKMPWEEAAFFYLTALLVAQSFIMLLPELSR
jgi:lycopene beta-cyclase